MAYIKAVLKKDNNEKIIQLKKIIKLGKELNKDTSKDELNLSKLQGDTLSKETKVSSENKKTQIESTKNTNISSNLKKDAIKEIFVFNENNIVIKLNRKVEKNDLKFFELKTKQYSKDVFDIKAKHYNIKDVKLNISGIDKIAVGQYKSDIFRLVLSNKKNLKTSYIINNDEIIVTIDSLEKKYTVSKKQEKPYIDNKNFIRTMYTKNNQIIVEFNKNLSKKHFKYLKYKYQGKFQNSFDIKGKFAHTKPIKLSIDGIEKIVVANKGSNETRIRISDSKNLKVIYTIKRKSLVITVKDIIPNKVTVPSKVIVIDPGHGKRDVGAVGPDKRYEKVVTLKVSKKLYKILKDMGHKVYLTRDNDSFIKVNNRTILANKKKADIFISVHANSVPRSKANKVQGIETFFLSPARSERAKRVAAKENKSDLRVMSNSTKQAFLESLNRPRITASHKLAIDTQAGMLQSVRSKYRDVKDSGVREGPFWVLVGAQMPSILIELGYMSHPIESKRLYSNDYQQLLAEGIANGVNSYFSKNP